METKNKQDNELIAEFMGWERYSQNSFKCPNTYPIDNSIRNGWTTFSADQLEFGSRWDWLMPVWYKFKSLIFPDYKQSEHYGQYKQIIKHAIINDGIETACKELVEGIKWYNQKSLTS